MSTIVERIATSMEAKTCSLLLLSRDRQRMWMGHTCGLSQSYLQKKPLFADTGIITQCCADCRPVSVLKASEDQRIHYQEEVLEEKA